MCVTVIMVILARFGASVLGGGNMLSRERMERVLEGKEPDYIPSFPKDQPRNVPCGGGNDDAGLYDGSGKYGESDY